MSNQQLIWTVVGVVNLVTYSMSPNLFSVLGGVVAVGMIIFGRS